MASSLLVAFLLVSSYAVVCARSSRPIAGGVETIRSAAHAAGEATAAPEADDGGRSHRRRGGGAGVVARYLVAGRSVMGMVPRREPARRPRTPPSPMPNKPVSSGMPPCLGDGCGRIR